MSVLSIKILDVIERDPRDKVPVGRSSNLVFTIWAVFGGFILHFLLSNYLTVLLRPRFEKPVESAADLIARDIHLSIIQGGIFGFNFLQPHQIPIIKKFQRDFILLKILMNLMTCCGK